MVVDHGLDAMCDLHGDVRRRARPMIGTTMSRAPPQLRGDPVGQRWAVVGVETDVAQDHTVDVDAADAVGHGRTSA